MALYDYLEPEENQISFRAGELIWVGTDGVLHLFINIFINIPISWSFSLYILRLEPYCTLLWYRLRLIYSGSLRSPFFYFLTYTCANLFVVTPRRRLVVGTKKEFRRGRLFCT